MSEHDNALICDGESDYILREEATSCWVTVGNISVYIIRTDEGVVVDLYPLDDENNSSLASTYAFSHEAQAIIDKGKL